MNLLCIAGKYSGTADSPIGSYQVAGGSFSRNELHLNLTQDSSQIAIDLHVTGTGLKGSFTSGKDHGPVELERVGDALAPSSSAVNLALTASEWRQDLRYLAKELTKLHPEPFAHTSRERFERETDALSREIGHLDADQIYMRLDQLANLIGDAHTYVEFPPDEANLPLDIRTFGEWSRIVAVTPHYRKALGARVLAIGHTPIKQVRKLASSITPVAETAALNRSRVDGFITTGMVLHGLGITSKRDSARCVLTNAAGKAFTVDFKALKPGEKTHWISARRLTPISAQPVDGSASCTFLAGHRALYCNVVSIRGLQGASERMVRLLKSRRPDKVIIDLRQNGGGDYHVGIRYLIKPLQNAKRVNRKRRLFVLIGPDTFSAAMANAAQFRSMTNAILVGESIGERPNSYQEPRQFRLPNSHLVVRYSTRYYHFMKSARNVVAPDKTIKMTWNDFKDGRDPVLAWALAYPD